MGQTSRVAGRNTKVFDRDGDKCVQYHATIVVRWNDKRIILNTGGYETVTTKTRMNQASNQYGLGYSVYQKDHQWFVTFKGETMPFEGETLELTR